MRTDPRNTFATGSCSATIQRRRSLVRIIFGMRVCRQNPNRFTTLLLNVQREPLFAHSERETTLVSIGCMTLMSTAKTVGSGLSRARSIIVFAIIRVTGVKSRSGLFRSTARILLQVFRAAIANEVSSNSEGGHWSLCSPIAYEIDQAGCSIPVMCISD